MDKDEKSANKGAKNRIDLQQWNLNHRCIRSSETHVDEIEQSAISKMELVSCEFDNGNSEEKELFGSESESEHLDNENGLSNSNLPGELLAKIFKMVPISQWTSLEFVSRSFQGAVHGLFGQLHEIRLDELAYKKEMKQNNPCQLVDAVLEKFLFRAPNVVSISGFSEFSSIRLSTVHLLSKFEYLQTIEFSGQRVITESDFAVFLESSASRESWKRLDIDGGIYETMSHHGTFGSEENYLTLKLECFKFNARYLQIYDRFLPIDWSGLQKLVVVGSSFHGKEVLSVIRQCNRVAHLEIKIPQCGNENGQASFADFMQAVADLENLSVLKIIGNSSRSPDFHEALLLLIQDLFRRPITDLSVVECYCNDHILHAIINHLTRLTLLELDVENCTAESLERLPNTMGQLNSLKFRLCGVGVDGNVVRAIVGNMIELQCLHLGHLTNVNSQDLTRFGDLGMLKELRITTKNIKFGILQSWARQGFGSCMETLELFLQDGISSGMMADFLRNMPRLHWMQLRGATNGVLEAIGESCPNLFKLELWGSPTITSAAIQSVIDRCSRLKLLRLVGYSAWFPTALSVGKYRKITFRSTFDEYQR